ncbi:MAG: DNA mismatch repair endonuclease MutL [Pseudomonadota bacterium]
MEIPAPRPVRLLPDAVANQIAAGEVVERPASVLKELMENALDAGAGRVAVNVEAGGRRLIRVVDDGCGMGPDDLLLALERHATSKLMTSDDLARVATLGFRGEALPSIAAVSRLTLRSRPHEAETGYQARMEGGSLRENGPAGCPPGTVVEVADLFYNLPARRKFLKSPATEAGHLGQAFLRLALARPEVALRYSVANQALYDPPAVAELPLRAAALLGRESVAQMTPVAATVGPLTLTGLAGLPSLSRPQADQVFTYVNRRHVRDRLLLSAVGQAYRGLMPDGRRPVLVLMIGLDPELVDVNVHPAKVEVRFRAAQEVHQALVEGLRRALAGAGGLTRPAPAAPAEPTAPEPPFGPAPAYAPPAPDWPPPPPAWPTPKGVVRDPAWAAEPARQPTNQQVWTPPASPPAAPAALPGGAWPRPTGPEAAPAPRPLFTPAGELTVIGQLHGLYILCSSPEGLVIIDQHAAHERLTYEAMKRAAKAGPAPRQGLLMPATLELTPMEAAGAQAQAPAWARLGLEIAPFGGRTWSVGAVPLAWAGLDPAPLVRDILSELTASGLPPDTPEFQETALRALACRASVKQGQRLSAAELEDLVRRVAALPPPVTCPHGRPVMLLLSRRDMLRGFKRGLEPA